MERKRTSFNDYNHDYSFFSFKEKTKQKQNRHVVFIHVYTACISRNSRFEVGKKHPEKKRSQLKKELHNIDVKSL